MVNVYTFRLGMLLIDNQATASDLTVPLSDVAKRWKLRTKAEKRH